MTDTLDRPRLSREERAALAAEQAWRRKFFGWVAAITALLLGVAAAFVLWFTPLLGLDAVDVNATDGRITVDQDREIRGQVGVTDGTPLIRIDLDAVEARVESLPGVSDAAVSRHWPGTLRIIVTTRVGVAAVAANSSWYLLDAGGNPFQNVPTQPPGVVVLRLATPGPQDPATLAGITVVQALPAAVLPLVQSVSAHSTQNITVELADGRVVQWGSTAESELKAQILPAVLTREGTQFDISDPELVTVR